MNRLYYTLLATLISFPAIQALDIKTDASCKKLVTAIEQGQKLEKCSTAWQNITQSKTIMVQDQKELLDQSLQLAQTQKTTLEQELVNLGDEIKDHSKIKWGAGQLALGTYLWLGEAYVLRYFLDRVAIRDTPGWQIVWLDAVALDKKWLPEDPLLIFILSRAFLINPVLGTYCLYKAYHNLKQGLNYKQFLQDKITNLDAIITYLQDLQTPNGVTHEFN